MTEQEAIRVLKSIYIEKRMELNDTKIPELKERYAEQLEAVEVAKVALETVAAKKNKTCENCMYWDNFTGACCNSESEYRADFTSCMDSCDKWEGLTSE